MAIKSYTYTLYIVKLTRVDFGLSISWINTKIDSSTNGNSVTWEYNNIKLHTLLKIVFDWQHARESEQTQFTTNEIV